MTLNTFDLSRITIDYLFRDRERLVDIMLVLAQAGDDDATKQFVAECESRCIDVDLLAIEADQKYDYYVKAMTGDTTVSGGAKIQVPFIYEVKDKL